MPHQNQNQKLSANLSLLPLNVTIQNQAEFFDKSLDLLCVLNASGEIVQVNQSFASVFGLVNSGISKGLLLAQLIHSSEDDEAGGILANLENFTSPVSFEGSLIGVDDSEKWYLWTIYPNGADLFHVVGRNITPYKEMDDKELERDIFAEALLDTVLAINASLSLEHVLKRILSNIGKVVAYDYVTIFLVDGHTAEIVGIQSKTPYSIEINLQNRKKLPIENHKYLHSMFQKRESIIIPHVIETPEWMISAGITSHSGAFLGTPIVVEDTIIGFIGVFNTVQDFFTLLHAQQVSTFANHIGIAIVNARLYEQSQSAAILRERQRVAQELHDSVNQDLFAASTYADLLNKAIKNKPELIERYATDISQLIRGAVEQMRMILIELHPDTLTQSALPTLIQQLSQSFSNRTGIPVNFHSNTNVILESNEQIAVYRIVQETLHNIEKHAEASTVSVTVKYEHNRFQVEIVDDGIGFIQDHLTEFQLGIKGMRERALRIGANLEIESQPLNGTRMNFSKEYQL